MAGNAKATDPDSNSNASKKPSETTTASATTAAATTKAPAVMDEDDEFEDFPVEDWPDEETELGKTGTAGGTGEGGGKEGGGPAHLWEESWDDDDTSGDFAAVLREELRKVDEQGGKGRGN